MPAAPGTGEGAGPARILGSLRMGLLALRGSPVRTALSTLGVVIGVAGLVAILSFGDGLAAALEREGLAAQAPGSFTVIPSTIERIDFIPVAPAAPLRLTREDQAELQRLAGDRATVALGSQIAHRFPASGAGGPGAAYLIAATPETMTARGWVVEEGRPIEEQDLVERRPVAVVATNALGIWDIGSPDDAVGRSVELLGVEFEIVGVKRPDPALPGARILIPFPFEDLPAFEGSLPTIRVIPTSTEDTERLVQEVRSHLAAAFPASPFQIQRTGGALDSSIQQMRAVQMMVGAIVGISILVGGIGIMNVMLASVLERTREIGIQRAVGARRSDVLYQFLAESVAVSVFGSLIGLVLGFGLAAGGAAIIRRLTDAPISATLTPGTLALIGFVAVFVGLVFGAYPARQAANLAPIDAMRHE